MIKPKSKRVIRNVTLNKLIELFLTGKTFIVFVSNRKSDEFNRRIIQKWSVVYNKTEYLSILDSELAPIYNSIFHDAIKSLFLNISLTIENGIPHGYYLITDERIIAWYPDKIDLSIKQTVFINFISIIMNEDIIANKIAKDIVDYFYQCFMNWKNNKTEYTKQKQIYDSVLNKAYATLGLDITATIEEVELKWKELFKKNHPDLFMNDKILFQQKSLFCANINEAHDIIIKTKR
jgi:hypothetical protein